MATILLNGVAFDAANVTDNNDKLTVSGGNSDALDVNLAGGDDLIEVFAENGNFTNTTLRGGEGDDVLTAVAGFEDPDNLSYVGAVSFAQSMVGGPGEDTITVGDGLVSITGIAKGNEDDDTFTVANINGGTVQGNSGDDSITIGFAPGFGTAAGSLAAASVTNGTVNGGQGADDITIDDDVTVTGSAVRGNEGKDFIFISEDAEISADSTINGNAGDDEIDAAGAGAFSVLGGAGHDILRIGSGQTAVGGKGADTFSIEDEGGATITDYDNDDEADCFCDDVIQIDGNKIDYDTYEYKLGYKDYTSASSWKGNIRVKAVADKVECTVEAAVDYAATKTSTLDATAVIKYDVKTDLSLQLPQFSPRNPADLAKGVTNGVDWYTRNDTNIPFVDYPATGFKPSIVNADGVLEPAKLGLANGNEPRTRTAPFASDHIVEGIGFGYAEVTGYWTYKSNDGAAKEGPAIQTNSGWIRSALVYTRESFEKGDFSFLGLTRIAYDDCDITQTLVFDDVSNATITNHWRSYIKEKTTTTASLYSLSFGTANFGAVVTGKANLMISKGISITGNFNDEITDGMRTNTETWGRTDINYTENHFVRSKSVEALDAVVSLNLDGKFDAWVRRNGSADLANGGVKVSSITDEGALVSWAYHKDISWMQAGTLGIRTLSVATSIFGKNNTAGGRTFNLAEVDQKIASYSTTLGVLRKDGTFKQQVNKVASKQTKALATQYSYPNYITLTGVGANQALADTRVRSGTLQVKIAVDATATADLERTDEGELVVDPSMNIWVDRAVIPKQTFDITSCTFPTTIYGNRGDGVGAIGNVHNYVTPAYLASEGSKVEQTGEFNTRYLWNAGDMQGAFVGNALSNYSTLAGYTGSESSIPVYNYPINSLQFSNGCDSESFSCELPATAGIPDASYVVAADAIPALNTAFNQGFFSGSQWSVDVLAKAGMGDNVEVRNPNSNAADTVISTAVGAPFRVLFFDTKGSDNGLYIYSGTANYKAGDVTAINTAPEAAVVTKSSGTSNSYFGGKETIVKVTGGKGHEIALSDINFV